MVKGSISDTIKNLEKRYGVVITHLDSNKSMAVDVIPTRILPLDIATGIGGIPRGYFTEVFSQDAVGKTTFCIQLVASAQDLGLGTVYIDMEHRFDPIWAMTLGVDLSKLYFVQPPHGEAALNVARAMVESGEIGLVVIDSIPALVPKAELEGNVGDQYVGLQPRIIAQNFRQMTPALKKSNTAVVLTNQIRAKIGGGGSLAYGPQQTTPGGWSVKFYASMRIEMKRIKTVTTPEGSPVGHIVRVTTKKNSLAVPLRTVDLHFVYGVGFDGLQSIIDMCIVHGLIVKSGAWYSVQGQDGKMQGRTALYEFLQSNSSVIADLTDRLRSIFIVSGVGEIDDYQDE